MNLRIGIALKTDMITLVYTVSLEGNFQSTLRSKRFIGMQPKMNLNNR